MEPRWHKQYDYVPAHPEYARGTLYEQFCRSAYRNRYKSAVDYFGASLRYDRLLSRADTAANALVNLGIKAGDRICICLPNMPSAAVLFYAASRIGAVVVMVEERFDGGVIIHVAYSTDFVPVDMGTRYDPNSENPYLQ